MASTGRRSLGEGGFGCAVNPPFVCEGDKHEATNAMLRANPSTYVSKVFSNEMDAEKEYEAGRSLVRIDPEGRFFILPLDQCKTESLARSVISGVCPSTASKKYKTFAVGDDTAESFDMLVYANGGNNMLQNLESSAKGFIFSDRDLVLSLSRIVMEGLPALLLARMLHGDIKLDNIVMPRRTVAKLIDFGQVETFESTSESISNVYQSSGQERFPPELFWIVNTMKRDVPYLISQLHILPTRTRFEDQVRMDAHQKDAGKFLRDFDMIVKTSRKTRAEVNSILFVDTYDTYSLGYVIMYILYMKQIRDEKITEFAKEEYEKLKIWLRHVMDEDGFARWNADDGAEFWPCVWDSTLSPKVAEDMGTDISKRATERRVDAIRTRIFKGQVPRSYKDVDFFRATSTSEPNAAFQGAVGYARGGKRTFRRGRSKTGRRSASRKPVSGLRARRRRSRSTSHT